MKKKQILYSNWQARRLRRLPAADLHAAKASDVDVLVSLTSIPSRFADLDLVVRSVLSQSVAPKRMVLWLNEQHQNNLPRSLLDMVGAKFEIRYTPLDSCHCKLAPSLAAFPDQVIVTCDDDLMYRRGWMQALLESHRRAPQAIVAHIARTLTLGPGGEVLPYDDWPKLKRRGVSSHALVQMGYGGVLYPPGALHANATDADLFMALAPRADDLWFKFMAWLTGTQIRTADRGIGRPREIVGSDQVRLKPMNVNQDLNRKQWLQLCEHYGVDSRALLDQA